VVVVLREDRPGDKRLVAYFVPGERPAAAEDLRALLHGQLPEYMVPTAFVPLAALPLTPSGKVDRKALPAPDYSAGAAARYVAPRTPLEAFLAGVFAEVLGLEQVSVHGDFFELGGNSLMATQVATLVQEVLPLEIPLRNLFEARTVARVVETLEQSREQMDAKQRDIMNQMLSEIDALFGEAVGEESAVG
jgi:acyl carrier protein